MKKIRVELGNRSYYIWVGAGVLSRIGSTLADMKLARAAYIITNKKIRSLYGKTLQRSLAAAGLETGFCIVADSERSKSSVTWLRVLKDITGFDRGKGVVIIALGGGVIGDLSGFVASTYRRGVPFIQVPTTLLAQVDSAIGGKVAIDTEYAKNLIGAFYQPKAVFSDISLLNSLSLREVRNGLAEVIKYGIILDKGLFSYIEERLAKILKRDAGSMEYIVSHCSRLKAQVVSQDEQERLGFRSILNFGHTLGHGIEAAAFYRKSVSHGEAISVGMLAAFDIAVSLKIVEEKVPRRVENLIMRTGLPTHIKNVSMDRVLEAASYDKKIIRGKARWILPLGIGHAIVCHAVPAEAVKAALIKRLGA